MNYSRVLLVTPYSPGRFFGGIRPPVGMGYIEEYIRSYGIITTACDMNAGYRLRHLVKIIDEFKPEIIGFTVMSYQFRHTYSLIRIIKERFPSIAIAAGGPHVSALEERVLLECSSIDYVIAGEGETSMLGLCTGAPPELVGGVFSRSNGRIISGGPRCYMSDLDILPFPTYSSYDLKKYPEIEISTSRGCPHPCIFCAVSTIMGEKIRSRSIHNVADEISFFHHRHGKRSFQIGDDNFLADKEKVVLLCEEIASRQLKGLILRCGQGIRGDLIDRESLTAMKKAGFRHLGIGVESGCDHVLSSIRKGETVQKIEQGIALACRMGFDVSLLFVIGAPGETPADLEQSILLAKKYPVMKAFFFNLIPFPGTQLFKWAEENNAFIAPFDDLINRRDELKLRSSPFFETKEMSLTERETAMWRTEKVSKEIQIRAMERKLSRWGIAGRIGAQSARFDILERFFIRNTVLRKALDRLVFANQSNSLSGGE
jgi:radical SAM superfamily enzyme YgiQ (UPF0313 family)